MNKTEYCSQAEPDAAGAGFRSLTFCETSRFQKDLRTGAFLWTGLEGRPFVAPIIPSEFMMFGTINKTNY